MEYENNNISCLQVQSQVFKELHVLCSKHNTNEFCLPVTLKANYI